MASAFSDVAMSSRKGRDSPWRNALRLDFNRPAAVLGPVLFCALARLAAICFSVATKALLLLGGLVRIVIVAQATTLGFLAEQATAVFPGCHHAIEHREATAFELSGLGVKYCHCDPIFRQRGHDLLAPFCTAVEIFVGQALGIIHLTDLHQVIIQGLVQPATDER